METTRVDGGYGSTVAIQGERVITPSIISWGAVFAGATTVLSVSILLGLLGVSMGFGALDPMAEQPAEGLGLGAAIWTAVTVLISLAAGGFVAGYLAGAGGWSHGLLSWSVALVTALVLSTMAVGGTLRMTSSLLGSVASATGSAASSAASGAGRVVSSVADQIGDAASTLVDRVEGELDLDELEGDILDTLRATGIDALDPDRLQDELAAARSDVTEALSALRNRPDRFEEIASELRDDLTARAEGIVAEIDREDAVDALVANTDLTRPEAEAAIDNAISEFEDLSQTAQARVTAAQEMIEDARAELAALEADLREAADEAATAASRGALWAFVTLLLGGAASVGAGIIGRRQRLPHSMAF